MICSLYWRSNDVYHIWFMVTVIYNKELWRQLLTVSINYSFIKAAPYKKAAWDKTDDHSDRFPTFKMRLYNPRERQCEKNQTSPHFICWHFYDYSSNSQEQVADIFVHFTNTRPFVVFVSHAYNSKVFTEFTWFSQTIFTSGVSLNTQLHLMYYLLASQE